MSGGPILPSSALPKTAGKVFPLIFEGATNGRLSDGLGVMASLDGDAEWDLEFDLSNANPGGTLKLEILSTAEAAGTQSAYLRILWAAVAEGEEPDEVTLQDEHSGGDLEIEHTAAGAGDLVVTEVTLDADTIVYGTDKLIKMTVALKAASWDLAVNWWFRPRLVWE